MRYYSANNMLLSGLSQRNASSFRKRFSTVNFLAFGMKRACVSTRPFHFPPLAPLLRHVDGRPVWLAGFSEVQSIEILTAKTIRSGTISHSGKWTKIAVSATLCSSSLRHLIQGVSLHDPSPLLQRMDEHRCNRFRIESSYKQDSEHGHNSEFDAVRYCNPTLDRDTPSVCQCCRRWLP